MKKNIGGSLLLMILGASLYAQAPGGVVSKALVAVDKVIEAEDMESRNYTGIVVSQAKVEIISRVSGEIMKIGFKDGAILKKGQVLYQLDSTKYEAAVKSAEAKVIEYKARLEYAQNNFDRNHSLYKKDAVSKDAVENVKSALEVYKASLLAAEADLIMARDDLKNTRIVAPIEGIAGVTNFTVGNYTTPSSGLLLSIIQVQPIRVRFSISTGDLLSMFDTPGDLLENAIVRVKLSNDKLYPSEGKIEFLNNEANRKTDTIQLFVRFPNDDYKLITGSTVGVTLSKKKGRMLPAVLPSAVMYDSQGSYVYTVDKDGKVEKRYIVTGNSTPDLQMVVSGLKSGETVICKGNHKTMHGGQVETIQVKK